MTGLLHNNHYRHHVKEAYIEFHSSHVCAFVSSLFEKVVSSALNVRAGFVLSD